jgi:AraC-like DNA-binding protein
MDDALSVLLRDVRPQGALFDQAVLCPPWSLRFEERTQLVLLTMFSGEAWLGSDAVGGVTPEPVRLRPGDVAIVVGPEPYVLSDDPGRAPRVVVHSATHCTTPGGALLIDDCPGCRQATGARDGRGDGGDGEGPQPVALKGTYRVESSVSQRVLDVLPRFVRVPAPPGGSATLEMIAEEIHRHVPGQQVVLDRLLELLLVSSLRAWFELPEASAPSWYRAYGDPVVSRALKLLHEDPARPWTVAALAATVGVSRAGLARRFTELMGRPPMAYLTEWRICLAADLLSRTDETVEAVSRRVGYANAYALSVAFKRTKGVRPTEHRAMSRTA